MLWYSRFNPNILHLGVERKVLESKQLSPPLTQKPECGDGCGWQIQISTLHNHSIYLQWGIGRVEMLWIAQISPNSLSLGVRSGRGLSKLCPPPWLKIMLWWPFQSPYTNLHLLQPFIILIMRSWKGGDVMISWINPNILHLGVKHRVLRAPNWYHPQLKMQGVVMVVDDEFKPQPCTTIHYTYNETLKGLRCYELLESVQTQSILVWKSDKGKANFDPTRVWKTRCGEHFRAHIPISTFSNHSLYL